jgi:hypothetical protein
VAGGTVFVGADDAKLYAVDAATGAVRWTATTGAALTVSSPAVADGRVFVGSPDQKLYAFDAATGAQLWNTSTGAAVEAPPTVADGVVYAASDKLYALDPATGRCAGPPIPAGPCSSRRRAWSAARSMSVPSTPKRCRGCFAGSSGSSPQLLQQLHQPPQPSAASNATGVPGGNTPKTAPA